MKKRNYFQMNGCFLHEGVTKSNLILEKVKTKNTKNSEICVSMCVVIHVTRATTPVPSEYLLPGHTLQLAGGSKYLGVKISDNLSFHNHIQKICTSASRSLDS